MKIDDVGREYGERGGKIRNEYNLNEEGRRISELPALTDGTSCFIGETRPSTTDLAVTSFFLVLASCHELIKGVSKPTADT